MRPSITRGPCAGRRQRTAPLALGVALATACAGTTRGEEVELSASFLGDPGYATTETSLGWSLELSEARVVLGPIHGLEADLRAARPTPLRERLAALVLPSRAYAHPGHDHAIEGRRVLFEVLELVVVDALDATPQRFALTGESGFVDGVRVGLGGGGDALFGAATEVAGRARRGDEDIAFRGRLELPRDALARRVIVPLDAEVAQDGALTVVVDPRRWLDGVDFARLAQTPRGEPRECDPCDFDAGTQPMEAWRIGLRDPGALQVALTAAGSR